LKNVFFGILTPKDFWVYNYNASAVVGLSVSDKNKFYSKNALSYLLVALEIFTTLAL
jgi:hypothetical protein